jgi:hypothetical protein
VVVAQRVVGAVADAHYVVRAVAAPIVASRIVGAVADQDHVVTSAPLATAIVAGRIVIAVADEDDVVLAMAASATAIVAGLRLPRLGGAAKRQGSGERERRHAE